VPYHRLRVQGWSAKEVPRDGEDAYEAVTCVICRRVHLVNPATGKVLGEDDNE